MRIITLGLFLSLNCFGAMNAKERSCHSYQNQSLKTYTYTYFFMKIFRISYIKDPKGFEQVNVSYMRNLATKYTMQGWTKVLKRNISNKVIYEKNISWILMNNKHAKLHDCFRFTKDSSTLKFLINGKLQGLSKDQHVISNVFHLWLGGKPMSKRMARFLHLNAWPFKGLKTKKVEIKKT